MTNELIAALLAEDGYPSDEGCSMLRAFTGTPRELVEDVLQPTFGRMGSVWVEDEVDHLQRNIKKVNLATGGWSGNEQMIVALEWDYKTLWSSFFWFCFWEQSRRGGGYTFHVPVSQWDVPMPEWPPTVPAP